MIRIVIMIISGSSTVIFHNNIDIIVIINIIIIIIGSVNLTSLCTIIINSNGDLESHIISKRHK